MNFLSLRLLIVSGLVVVLVVAGVNLVAAPWRAKRLAQVVDRVEQALCYEQPATAERLMVAADRIDPAAAEVQLRSLRERSQSIQTDMTAARTFFTECGNKARVAVIDDVTRTYSTPKEAVEKALELNEKGESTYAQQLLRLAISLDADYSGLEAAKTRLQ